MFATNEKIGLALGGVTIVGCVVIAIWARTKMSYYQGRIDATKDLTKEFEIIRQNLEDNKKEGEA